MAFYDDPQFIISHIRNSFITSDDTGMCEIVMGNENMWIHPQANKDANNDVVNDYMLDANTDTAHSFEIVSDLELGAHRRRSNTAQRLERLKKERKLQSKITNIPWKDGVAQIPPDILIEMFEKKSIQAGADKAPTSALARLIQSAPQMEKHSLFSEYALFDGNANASAGFKKIRIFLTMQPINQRNYPMPVCVTATAKVVELIGLICWYYTKENRQPKLKHDINMYSLYITEDDGEVDFDFPALDHKEVIAKFGFTSLALVEKEAKIPQSPNPPVSESGHIDVRVHFPNGSICTIPVTSLNTSLRTIYKQAIEQRQKDCKMIFNLQYRLEKQTDPGIAVNLDTTLSAVETTDFCLVREHSKRPGEEMDMDDWTLRDMTVLEAPLYQSYRVVLINRFKPRIDVQLGISGEKIEVDVINQKSSKFWTKPQKATTYRMETVLACNMTDVKSSGKAIFRLTFKNEGKETKHQDFETDASKAHEVVQKINNNLDMRSSPLRKEYREHRYSKRYSFSLGNKFTNLTSIF